MLQAYSPQSLAKLVWSLGHLRFKHEGLCSAAVQQLSSQIPSWPLSCCGLVLWGLAQVQHDVDRDVLDSIARALSVKLLTLRTSTDGQRLGKGKLPVGGVLRGGGGAGGSSSSGDEAVVSVSGNGSNSWNGSSSSSSSSSSIDQELGNCRAVAEACEAVQCALVRVLWSMSMLEKSLSTDCSALYKECFKMLGAFEAEDFAVRGVESKYGGRRGSERDGEGEES